MECVEEQRQQGAVILHFIGAIYFFTVSGLIINYYFIPSAQCICQDLNITPVSENIFLVFLFVLAFSLVTLKLFYFLSAVFHCALNTKICSRGFY